jgi:hypothetical protein
MGDSCTDIHRDSASVFRLNSSPMMATLNILPPPTVGLQDNNETKFNLEAFPNPFDEVLKLKFSSTKPNIVQIKILDSMCRLVLSKTEKINESGNYYTEFDTSELSRGLYFISLSDDSGSYISSKIILKNN